MKKALIVSIIAAATFGSAYAGKVKTKWGEEIKLTNSISLSQAIKDKSMLDKEILISGKVEKVCVKKGCWMTVKDKQAETRITFKDYGFFVDNSLLGKTVLAQGKLNFKTVSKAHVEHYLVDEGMDPKKAAKIAKEKKTFSFIASGVKIASAGK